MKHEDEVNKPNTLPLPYIEIIKPGILRYEDLWVYLTDVIFETGEYRVPSKSQNPNILGQGVHLVPNVQTLAGHAVGTIHLAPNGFAICNIENGLTLLFSRQILNGSQNFFVFYITTF